MKLSLLVAVLGVCGCTSNSGVNQNVSRPSVEEVDKDGFPRYISRFAIDRETILTGRLVLARFKNEKDVPPHVLFATDEGVFVFDELSSEQKVELAKITRD